MKTVARLFIVYSKCGCKCWCVVHNEGAAQAEPLNALITTRYKKAAFLLDGLCNVQCTAASKHMQPWGTCFLDSATGLESLLGLLRDNDAKSGT